MVDATPFLPGLSPVQGKAVVARFDGAGCSRRADREALTFCRARLSAFPREKLHKLLDIIIPQVDAQNLAGVGPHPEKVVRHIDPIDDEQGTIVPANDEPPCLSFHRLVILGYS